MLYNIHWDKYFYSHNIGSDKMYNSIGTMHCQIK